MNELRFQIANAVADGDTPVSEEMGPVAGPAGLVREENFPRSKCIPGEVMQH